jgi:hypothetical protein
VLCIADTCCESDFRSSYCSSDDEAGADSDRDGSFGVTESLYSEPPTKEREIVIEAFSHSSSSRSFSAEDPPLALTAGAVVDGADEDMSLLMSKGTFRTLEEREPESGAVGWATAAGGGRGEFFSTLLLTTSNDD